MYQVETNKYQHEGSGASRVDSTHDSLPDAIDAAEKLWQSGYQRFVYVIGGMKAVYYVSGRYHEGGNGRVGYSDPSGELERPESFGASLIGMKP